MGDVGKYTSITINSDIVPDIHKLYDLNELSLIEIETILTTILKYLENNGERTNLFFMLILLHILDKQNNGDMIYQVAFYAGNSNKKRVTMEVYFTDETDAAEFKLAWS